MQTPDEILAQVRENLVEPEKANETILLVSCIRDTLEQFGFFTLVRALNTSGFGQSDFTEADFERAEILPVPSFAEDYQRKHLLFPSSIIVSIPDDKWAELAEKLNFSPEYAGMYYPGLRFNNDILGLKFTGIGICTSASTKTDIESILIEADDWLYSKTHGKLKTAKRNCLTPNRMRISYEHLALSYLLALVSNPDETPESALECGQELIDAELCLDTNYYLLVAQARVNLPQIPKICRESLRKEYSRYVQPISDKIKPGTDAAFGLRESIGLRDLTPAVYSLGSRKGDQKIISPLSCLIDLDEHVKRGSIQRGDIEQIVAEKAYNTRIEG